MHLDDEKHMSFRSPLRVYCYTVMSFGLKNAGATYQRSMSSIFRDHLRKTMEYYVDNIAVNSRSKSSHLDDLRTVFDIMRAHQLRMNRTKSFLGVSNGKFLEFIVTFKRIHLNTDKVKAIQACNLRGPSKSSEVYKADSPISENSSQIFQVVANRLHLRMG